jgi:hypothetical protein
MNLSVGALTRAIDHEATDTRTSAIPASWLPWEAAVREALQWRSFEVQVESRPFEENVFQPRTFIATSLVAAQTA